MIRTRKFDLSEKSDKNDKKFLKTLKNDHKIKSTKNDNLYY